MSPLGEDLAARAAAAQREIGQELSRLDAEESAARFVRLDEGRYRFSTPGLVLEVDYLRRSNGQLKGEILAKTSLPGAKGFGGVLSVGDLNLSAPRSRTGFGRHLAERAKTGKDINFEDLVDEFCVRVLAAEREGEPAVLLSSLKRPGPDEALVVDGWPLLARHPTILFGDGGTAKSYLSLYAAGSLSRRGIPVAFFDWEFAGEDHRGRLESLFGESMPAVHYARCSRPFIHERDRLRRIIRDHKIRFAIFDSIAFACDGPPEAAEVAGRYFQALRSLGDLGSLHVAHITKAFEHADRRPFGSAFWHNGARATWNLKQAAPAPDDDRLTLGLYNRKQNTSSMGKSLGFEIRFGKRTEIKPVSIAAIQELAQSMSIGERIHFALQGIPLTREQLAEELGEEVKPASFRQALKRAIDSGKVREFMRPGEPSRLCLVDRFRGVEE